MERTVPTRAASVTPHSETEAHVVAAGVDADPVAWPSTAAVLRSSTTRAPAARYLIPTHYCLAGGVFVRGTGDTGGR